MFSRGPERETLSDRIQGMSTRTLVHTVDDDRLHICVLQHSS